MLLMFALAYIFLTINSRIGRGGWELGRFLLEWCGKRWNMTTMNCVVLKGVTPE